MRENPSESEKLESFERFREEMAKDVDEGVDDHESKMTKMGFMFLGIFVGVIALAAFLP
jgi:type II secretory pathway component PulF